MNMVALIDEIKRTRDCRIFPVAGDVCVNRSLPSDVATFYQECGGLVLYETTEYPVYIVVPQDVVPVNPVLLGEEYPEDRSADWFVIAHDGAGEYLSIDLHPERVGRCYDSFSEGHGVVGECPVIAVSFTDLLERLWRNQGRYWYWLQDGFESFGDAYD